MTEAHPLSYYGMFPLHRTRTWRILMMLGAVVFAGCQRTPSPDLTAPGISRELARHRASTIDELSYELDLSIPEARSEPLAGTVTLRLQWDDPSGYPLVVDLQEPGRRIQRVEVNGGEVPTLELHNNHLVLPADLLRSGEENVVRIELRLGDGPLNRQDAFLYTLFVPERAHHAIPVLDQPDLKARVSLSLDVPAGWEAVGNGRRTGEEPLADGRRRLTFAETEPISTYLIAFAAGEWERVQREVAGRPMVFYHRETDVERVADNLDEIFELHATALGWLEEYAGIPYPFDLFEFVAIPDFQYQGMEHPGAAYYRASSLFLEPSATQRQLLGRASLIAHETAHMWFGNLVTMRWFDDVWTKEVFANFYAAEIVNPSFPEIDHELRFLLAHHPAAYRVDRSRGANAIRQPLENLVEAGTLYGPIIYEKAPIVMRQLERLVGQEDFRAGMRRYLDRFAFGNATWPELIEILDPLTDLDLEAWSKVWVEEPGRPTLDVVREGGADGPRWRLEPYDPRAPTAGEGRVWIQTLDPVVGWEGASTPLGEVRVEGTPLVTAPVTAEGEGIAGATGPPDWLLPDGAGYGYARFRLDRESRGALLGSFGGMEVALHRASALLILWDAVLEGELAPGALLQPLVDRITAEENEQLLAETLGIVGSIYWIFLCPEERESWAPRVEAALVERLGGNESSTVKTTLFGSLRSIALTPERVRLLREVWAGEATFPNLTLGESERTATAFALALRGVDDWEGVLEREEASIENPERLERFRFLKPSVDPDPEVRERFFESLLDLQNRSREPWVQTGLAHLNHPLRAAHGIRFLRPSLELLEEIHGTGDIFFPQAWIGAALSGQSSPEAVRIVEDFLAERPDYPPRLREKVLQASDLTERAARIRGGGCAGGPPSHPDR